MAEDWSVNVRKYAPDADSAAIAGIVRHCGIALQSRDASLVSFTDKSETDRVRESFLKKKLGLTQSDADLDSSIAAVGETMKSDRMKNRVTVYYLLAEKFGKLGLFGGSSTTAASPVAEAAAGVGSAASGLAAVGAAGLAAGAATVASGFGRHEAPDEPAYSSVSDRIGGAGTQAFAAVTPPVVKSGLARWLPWLLLAAAALAVLLYLGLRNKPEVTAPVTSPVADAPAAALAPAPVAAAPVTIPTGAGVTTEVRDGKPVVNVYFDTGKADVVPAFGAAAQSLKTYLDQNAGSKLAVSGFNDKTGNAAANALLSKNRAEAVQAALVAAAIPAGSIELVKPSDTTDTATTNAGARRVEVVVK